MANKGPGTNGSQFFLLFNKASGLDALKEVSGMVKQLYSHAKDDLGRKSVTSHRPKRSHQMLLFCSPPTPMHDKLSSVVAFISALVVLAVLCV